MKKKQDSTRATANHTVRRKTKSHGVVAYKTCPKCGEQTLRRGTKAPSGKLRWYCVKHQNGTRVHCYSTTDPTKPYSGRNTQKTPDKNPQFKRALSGVKRFVVTAAQNATPIHDDFFASLKEYCKHNDAELVVIPLRYKNPTSRWTASQSNEERWDPALNPYLYNQRKKLNENLVLLGDIKTVPTATKPLSGFEAITHGESGILGHTKVQLTTIPTPQGRYPKILTTTGAVTVPNYTDSKAGKLGEFHHTLGAVAVDIIGKKFSMRQLNAEKDGSFIDLEVKYTSQGIEKAPRPLALVFGDTHRVQMDKFVEKVTFGKGGMVDQLNPENLVFHDLHDGYARNPHHRNDPFSEIAKRGVDMHRVRKEVEDDVEWLKQVCEGRQGIIVPSNHDNFFARWIADTDWRRDPDNAEFYLETALEMVRSTKMTPGGTSVTDPFIHWVNKLKGDAPITCLERDQSMFMSGVELGLHGDMGPNGARGTRNNLRRIGVKTIVGHSHSPGIEEGCYQTGTSTPLRLEYNLGPSSWLNCHCVLYANGKRSLLFIIDGEWRL